MKLAVKLLLLAVIGLCVFDVFVSAGPFAEKTKQGKQKGDKRKITKEPLKFRREHPSGPKQGGQQKPWDGVRVHPPMQKGQGGQGHPLAKDGYGYGEYGYPKQGGQGRQSHPPKQKVRGRQGYPPKQNDGNGQLPMDGKHGGQLHSPLTGKIKGIGAGIMDAKLKLMKEPMKLKKLRPAFQGGHAGGKKNPTQGEHKPWSGPQVHQKMQTGQRGQGHPPVQDEFVYDGHGFHPGQRGNVIKGHPMKQKGDGRKGQQSKQGGYGGRGQGGHGGQGHVPTQGGHGFPSIQHDTHVCSCGADTCTNIKPPTPEVGNLVCEYHRDTGCTVCIRLMSAYAEPEISKCCTFPKFAEDLESDHPRFVGQIHGHDTSKMRCKVYKEDGTDHGTTVNLLDLGGACPVHPDFHDRKFLADFFAEKECKVTLKGTACVEDEEAQTGDAGYNNGAGLIGGINDMFGKK
ncbi:uncharacterized protein [Amphiura filiformis]|uniref:uncharacterized protein n=1 Tax=Amphiura filiformis TaxID=82378 RepID=UPI003B214202